MAGRHAVGREVGEKVSTPMVGSMRVTAPPESRPSPDPRRTRGSRADAPQDSPLAGGRTVDACPPHRSDALRPSAENPVLPRIAHDRPNRSSPRLDLGAATMTFVSRLRCSVHRFALRLFFTRRSGWQSQNSVDVEDPGQHFAARESSSRDSTAEFQGLTRCST